MNDFKRSRSSLTLGTRATNCPLFWRVEASDWQGSQPRQSGWIGVLKWQVILARTLSLLSAATLLSSITVVTAAAPSPPAAAPMDDPTTLRQDADRLLQEAIEKYRRSMEQQPDPALEMRLKQLEQPTTSALPTESTPSETRAVVFADWFYGQFPPPANGSPGFERSRSYGVEASADGVDVTMNTLTWHNEDYALELGPLTLRVHPKPAHEVGYTLHMTDRIVIRKHDEIVGYVDIGQQDTRGLWREDLPLLMRSSGRLSDLRLSSERDEVSATLSDIVWSGRIDQGPGDSWHDQFRLEARDFALDSKGGDDRGHVHIDAVHASGQAKGTRFENLVSLIEKFNRLNETPMGAERDSTTQQQILRLVGELFEMISSAGGELEISGIQASGAGTTSVSIGRITIGGTMDNTHPTEAGMVYRFDISDIQGGKNPMVPPALLPTAMRLEFVVERLPNSFWKSLMELAEKEDGIPEPEIQQLAMQSILKGILKNRTSITLRHTYLTFQKSSITVDSNIQANPQAIFQATGTLSIVAENLPTLIAQVHAMSDSDQEIKRNLAVLQAFTVRSEKNGKTIDRLDFILDHEGRFMLNGKDMSALFAPQSQGKTPAQPPQGQTQPAQ